MAQVSIAGAVTAATGLFRFAGWNPPRIAPLAAAIPEEPEDAPISREDEEALLGAVENALREAGYLDS